MLEVFKEFLDKMFWEGYAEAFEDDDPAAFYSQYRDFNNNHGGLPI